MLFSTLILFAQKGGQVKPEDAAAMGIGIVIAIGCCVTTSSIVGIGFAIFDLMTCFKALSAVSQRNRDMEPGMIFMVLIPIFGAIWKFFIVFRIASSLRKEFRKRGIRSDGGDFGQNLGLWGLILLFVCGPVGFVMYIMWLFKIRGYTAELTGGDSDDD